MGKMERSAHRSNCVCKDLKDRTKPHAPNAILAMDWSREDARRALLGLIATEQPPVVKDRQLAHMMSILPLDNAQNANQDLDWMRKGTVMHVLKMSMELMAIFACLWTSVQTQEKERRSLHAQNARMDMD